MRITNETIAKYTSAAADRISSQLARNVRNSEGETENHKYYATCDDYEFNCTIKLNYGILICFASLSLARRTHFSLLMSCSRHETIEIYPIV